MSSFERSVKGATKIKLAAPKAKYIQTILTATHTGEAGIAEIFRTLTNRLRDSTWTIVFKSLIVVHLMIREGEPNVTLKYLAEQPSKLAISDFNDVQVQGSNIRHYYTYILVRAKAFRDTRLDWVKDGKERLKRQTVDKGLLRETENVQSQISALLRCDLLSSEPDNEITLTAFRLLTMDLLILYQIMNEGVINILEHYFEMSKPDAQRALTAYKTFNKQTDQVVHYLGTARQFESQTRLEIPKLKHAPTSLTASLTEYINDPDFDINRRQYLAQQDAKKGRKPAKNGTEALDDFKKLSVTKSAPTQKQSEPKVMENAQPEQQPKGPALDLIDFFDSIEQNQQPMAGVVQQQTSDFQSIPQAQQQTQGYPAHGSALFAQQPGQQPVAMSYANTNPFGQPQAQLPIQQNFTGAGFGGYTAHPQTFFAAQQQPLSSIPQRNSVEFSQPQQPFTTAQQQQPASTNPFRSSMIPQPTDGTNSSFSSNPLVTSSLNRQSTNPFARNGLIPSVGQNHGTPFTSIQSTGQSQRGPFPSEKSGPFSAPPVMDTFSTQQPPPQQPTSSILPQRTDTNPFARTASPSQAQTQGSAPSPINTQVAGNTNPFRQSAFANQQTGQGWQSSQGSTGGLEQLDTVPIFPRPGQALQQPQQQPWI